MRFLVAAWLVAVVVLLVVQFITHSVPVGWSLIALAVIGVVYCWHKGYYHIGKGT